MARRSRKLRFPDYVTMAQDGGKVVSLTHEIDGGNSDLGKTYRK